MQRSREFAIPVKPVISCSNFKFEKRGHKIISEPKKMLFLLFITFFKFFYTWKIDLLINVVKMCWRRSLLCQQHVGFQGYLQLKQLFATSFHTYKFWLLAFIDDCVFDLRFYGSYMYSQSCSTGHFIFTCRMKSFYRRGYV